MGKSSRFNKKQRKYHRHRDYPPSNNNASSSSSNQSLTTTNESDIPGYYYDEEKKTYFKILPNNMSSVGGFVTKESIKKKKIENRRILDRDKVVKESEKSCTKAAVSMSVSYANKKALLKSTVTQSLLNVLSSVQCGQYTCQSLSRFVRHQQCRKLKPQPGWEMGKSPLFASTMGEIRRVEMNGDSTKAVTVWSEKDSILEWMQLVNWTARNKKQSAASNVGSRCNLEICDTGVYNGFTTNKVTSLCWSPLSKIPGKTCVLFTSVCPLDYTGSRVSILNLEATSQPDAHMFSFDLGSEYVWSCAWNRHRSRFSVGCERWCHVIDVNNRCKWSYSSLNSDPLAQLFSDTNPHTLYTGTRSGFVLTIDLRAPPRSQQTAAKFNQQHPVVCLRSRKDDNYLMASDFSGLIRMWDLRFQKTVKKYTGLVNSHYHIPFYLDSTETFVYATGSDGYFKVWDVSDESLLKSIAPPLPSQSNNVFPVSHLSEEWGGLDGNFGLVTAMEKRFFLYS